ncbi:uncharacterized protein LOC141901926 isoform X1 [Tubulanus polymorphus]|uniref:uncharacterized protein LOC141901926 isoform X1 n=1 Tax=Tubulanus polymorphus TaxID=672921 RepID=UPI003DA4C98C
MILLDLSEVHILESALRHALQRDQCQQPDDIDIGYIQLRAIRNVGVNEQELLHCIRNNQEILDEIVVNADDDCWSKWCAKKAAVKVRQNINPKTQSNHLNSMTDDIVTRISNIVESADIFPVDSNSNDSLKRITRTETDNEDFFYVDDDKDADFVPNDAECLTDQSSNTDFAEPSTSRKPPDNGEKSSETTDGENISSDWSKMEHPQKRLKLTNSEKTNDSELIEADIGAAGDHKLDLDVDDLIGNDLDLRPLLSDIVDENNDFENLRTFENNQKQAQKKVNLECRLCLDEFSTHGDFRNHFRTTHPQTKPYMCTTCGDVFSYEQCLEFHIEKQHNSDKPDGWIKPEINCAYELVCRICNEIGDIKSHFDLVKHFEKEHPTLFPYLCIICGVCFPGFSRLQIHLQDVHECEVYTASDDITESCRSDKQLSVDYCADIVCHICGELSCNPLSLAKHFKIKHGAWKPFICVICEITFSSLSKLRGHQLKEHAVNKVEYDEDVVKKKNFPEVPAYRLYCQECNINLEKHIPYIEHFRTYHGEERPYSCRDCNQKMKTLSALNYHYRVKHLNYSMFTCDVCQKPMRNSQLLELHKLTHLDRKTRKSLHRFMCSDCGAAFERKSLLDSHIRSKHTNEVTDVCDVCGKVFYNKENHRTHMKFHAGIKKYNCNICDKRFVTSSMLTRHLTVHKSKKSHQCPVCLKWFARNDSMKAHCRSFHRLEILQTSTASNTASFTCDICMETFPTKSILDVHFTKHLTEEIGIEK